MRRFDYRTREGKQERILHRLHLLRDEIVRTCERWQEEILKLEEFLTPKKRKR